MPYSWIVLGMIAIFITGIITIYNSLVVKRNLVESALSNLDIQLRRRHNLVSNLIETAKGHKEYEPLVLEKVTKAMTDATDMGVGSIVGRMQAEDALSGSLKSLFASLENHPQTGTPENFRKLQEELSSIEDYIQSARRNYAFSARELSKAIKVYPASIVARIFNIKPYEFLSVNEKNTS